MRVTYNPEIFDVRNIGDARKIILTGEGSTTDERWKTETPQLVDQISSSMAISPESILIDYGCGIGRLARELIQRHGCHVIGVDISHSMRALSVDYVRSDRFLPCSPEMLDLLVRYGLAADGAISIWVLQHCLKPSEDIERIHRALKPGANVFILNNVHRAIPTREKAWVNDGIDIKAMLARHFSMLSEGKPLEEKTPRDLINIIFWALFQKTR
jgi:cyclopropane fatty-acyl-phospholipid synthase-like methyltransferase